MARSETQFLLLQAWSGQTLILSGGWAAWTLCIQEGYPAYLFGLYGERAHFSCQVHEAEVQGAIAVDAVGIVARANEHGAEQGAEVEAVPLLALEHGGRGIQVRGLSTGHPSAQPDPSPLTTHLSG